MFRTQTKPHPARTLPPKKRTLKGLLVEVELKGIMWMPPRASFEESALDSLYFDSVNDMLKHLASIGCLNGTDSIAIYDKVRNLIGVSDLQRVKSVSVSQPVDFGYCFQRYCPEIYENARRRARSS